ACSAMSTSDHHSHQQTGWEDERTHGYPLNAVDAAQKMARAGPGQDRREEGREEDQLREPEKERQHGDRDCAYNVRNLSGGFRAEPASEANLDRDQQTRLGSSRDDERDRSDVQRFHLSLFAAGRSEEPPAEGFSRSCRPSSSPPGMSETTVTGARREVA